jgi:hypothetical protein
MREVLVMRVPRRTPARPASRVRPLLFASMLPLALAAGCKKKNTETAFLPNSAEDVACMSICVRRAAELKCTHGDQCRDACTKLGDARYCVAQVRAFVACFTKQPTNEWECNGEGMPVIGGHRCEGEQVSMSDCLMQTNGKL